ATKAGLPDVMAHGMLSAGLLGSALTGWYGPGNVRHYAVRFKSPVWPGDVLTARCVELTVTEDPRRGPEAALVLELTRNGNDVVLTATARVAIETARGPQTEHRG